MSRRDDLNRLLVISFLVPPLVRALFPVGALAFPVVRLIEPGGGWSRRNPRGVRVFTLRT